MTQIFDPNLLADRFERTGAELLHQLEGRSVEELRFKPSPEKWSMLEVLVHLWDEERLDFRPRIQSTLEDPERPWPAIDPEGWVLERRYNDFDPTEALASFQAERQTSVAWLRTLVDPPWHHVYQHPGMGPLQAGDLMAAWLVHDPIHLRQLANLQVAWIEQQTVPWSTRYAMP